MRLSPLVAAATLLFCAGHVLAEGPKPELLPDEPFSYSAASGTLANGARVWALTFKGATRVTLSVSFLGGWADDPPGKEGTALIASRLLQRATAGSGGFSHAERVFASGAVQEFFLGAEELEVLSHARPGALGELLALETARLDAPLDGIGEADVAGAAENEARLLELGVADPGDAQAQERGVLQRALAGTRLDRPTPTPESLRAIRLADVEAWAAKVIVPARAALVATGPGEAGALLQQVGVAIVDDVTAAPAPIPRPSAIPPTPSAPRGLALHPRPGNERRLWLAWRIQGKSAGLLAESELASLELEARLRRRAGKDDLSSQVTGLAVRLVSSWSVSAVVAEVHLTKDADPSLVRRVLAQASRPSKDDLVSASERRIHKRWGDDFLRVVDVTGVPDATALMRLAPDRPPIEERVARRDRLDAKGGPRLSPDLFGLDRSVALLADEGATPQPTGPAGNALEWRSFHSLLGAAAPGGAEVRTLVDGPRLGAARRTRLPNGLEVLVVPGGATPHVDVRLVVRGDVPDVRAATLLPSLGMIFTKTEWSWDDRDGYFEGCAATEWTQVGESISLRAVVPTGSLDLALQGFACWARQTPNASGFREARGYLARAAEAAERSPAGRLASAFTAALYGDAHRAPPPADHVRALQADLAKNWFTRNFVPSRTLLVVTGPIDPARAIARAKVWLGGWSRDAVTEVVGHRPAPETSRLLLMDAPGAKIALIGLGARLPDRQGAPVVAELALREAFALAAEQLALPDGGAVTSLGGPPDEPDLESWLVVPAARAATATTGLREALRKLADHPLLPVDLALPRWLAARNEAYRYDHPVGAAQAAERLFLEGVPLDALDALPESLATLAPAEVQAAARGLAGKEILVVWGDATSIGPALKAAGLEPEVVAAPKERE